MICALKPHIRPAACGFPLSVCPYLLERCCSGGGQILKMLVLGRNSMRQLEFAPHSLMLRAVGCCRGRTGAPSPPKQVEAGAMLLSQWLSVLSD